MTLIFRTSSWTIGSDRRGSAEIDRQTTTEANSPSEITPADRVIDLTDTRDIQPADPASSPTDSTDTGATTPAVSRETDAGPHRARTVPANVSRGTDEVRAIVANSLPDGDIDTPLARQVSEDARRRIVLRDRVLPKPGRTTGSWRWPTRRVASARPRPPSTWPPRLAQGGLSVLVIDLDPQGNASTALGIDHHAEVPSIYDVVVEGRPLVEVVQTTAEFATLHCAPATLDLAGAEIELVSLVARENRLHRALQTYLQDREQSGMQRAGLRLHRLPAQPRAC